MSFTESNTVEQMIIAAVCGRRQPSPRSLSQGERGQGERAASPSEEGELRGVRENSPGYSDSLSDELRPAHWTYVPAAEVPRKLGDVMVEPWLREALINFNPEIAAQPDRADEVIYNLRAILLSVHADGLVRANENFMAWLRGEKTMPFGKNGEHVPVRLVDAFDPTKNGLIVTNQWTFAPGGTTLTPGPSPIGRGETVEKRFDVVFVVNGLPLVIGEAKTPTRSAVTWFDGAFQINQIYEKEIPAMFVPNVFSFATEGKLFRYGSIRMPIEMWGPWRDEEHQEEGQLHHVKTTVEKMLRPEVVLDISLNFTLFATDKKHRRIKIICRYQQYETTNQIIARVVKGYPKKGLIWHFQGSGKSLLMVFAAQKLRMHPKLGNPTVMIVVDRIDLDTQITATFNAADVPNMVAVVSREELQTLLAQDVRKVLITTIHKFGGSQLLPPSPQPSPTERGRQYRGDLEFSGLVKRARELRQNQTPAEDVFWELIRDRRFLDMKFRRQHQIGDYIVDFYCPESKLVVEFDGPVHEGREGRDETRDRYLRSLGNTVLRFKNDIFLSDPLPVLQIVAGHLPSTSGRGVGGEGWEGGSPLSSRPNIIVMVDEAHRTQEGDLGGR